MAKPEAFIRMVTTEAHISKVNMVGPLNWHKSYFEFCTLAIIHLRCSQIFTIFDPYAPCRQIWPILDPIPLKMPTP